LDPPGPPAIQVVVEVTGVATDQDEDDGIDDNAEIEIDFIVAHAGHVGAHGTDKRLSDDYDWDTYSGAIQGVGPVELYDHEECSPMNKITVSVVMEEDDPLDDDELGTGSAVFTGPGETTVQTANNAGPTGKVRIKVRTVPVENEGCKIKVVPIKFCILSDGVNADTADNDDGRFNQAKRVLGLLGKSLIFAQAGVLFKPQGFIIIPDPDPPAPGPGPGQLGDVYDPSQDSATIKEWIEVKADCDDAINRSTTPPGNSKEKLVDILIRRFVNGAGAPSGNVGWSQVPPCTAVDRPTAKPTINDPDTFPSFAFVLNPTPPPPFSNVANFVETLAHEDGHALCLPHVVPNVDFRLMNTGPFGNFVLSAQERANVRAEAQKISGTIDKNKNGERLPDPRPRSRTAVDDLEDVPAVQIDIMEATAVRLGDGGLALDTALAGVLPDTISGLEYVFMVDVDNDTGSGGSPSVSFSHSFQGADLVAEVTVSKTAGVPSVAVVAKRFEAGQFVDVVDPRIQADLVTLIAQGRSETGVPPDSFPIEDVVTFEIPADLLPVPLAEGYRVGSFAFDGNTLDLDEAPIVVGSVTEFPEPQSIMIDPITAAPGDTVLITGQEFNPNSTVEIFVGTQLVVTLPTSSAGSFAGDFTVPPVSDETFIFNEEWDEFVSPVTAIDKTTTQVGEQIEKKSDAVILQLPRKKVGGIVEFPGDGSDAPRSAADGPVSSFPYAALAGGLAAAVALATAGGWYVRRRRLR
jgi:hypothetical protein